MRPVFDEKFLIEKKNRSMSTDNIGAKPKSRTGA